MVLDSAGPPPAAVPFVGLWYRATSAYLQHNLNYAALVPHVARAREVLSADAQVFLLSGAMYENLAAPSIQSAVEDAGRPTMDLEKPEGLRAVAEKYLRRAVQLAPDLTTARLRLGRLLDLKGQHDEAAGLLRQAEVDLAGSTLGYYAAIYLGRAEQSRGHDADARAAFERAMALFPKAQSPRLALAELEWRGADPAAAVRALRALFAKTEGAGPDADPWWTYDISHVADSGALLEKMLVAAIEALR